MENIILGINKAPENLPEICIKLARSLSNHEGFILIQGFKYLIN